MTARFSFIIILLIGLLPFKSSYICAGNAPVATISNSAICPGTTFTTRITVTNFVNIGSLTLRIEYDSAVISFNPPPASFFNPLLGGASIYSSPVSGTIKKIMIAWASITPVSLSDGSMMATLSFIFIGGSTNLVFNNDSNGGGDCEYSDGSGNPLNDIPTAQYYINGQANSAIAAQPSPISGQVSPCQNSTAAYSVTNVTGVSYAWTVPADWTVNSGQGTSTISATVGTSGGLITVVPSDSCGNGPSRSLTVSPLLLPSTAGPITGPLAPCQGSEGNLYNINPVNNATGYLWTVPNTWSISSGQNTIAISAVAGTFGGDITVTASNSCGNSNTASISVSATQPPDANAGPNQVITYGSATTLNGTATGGSGNYSWHWEPASLLTDANVQNPNTVNLTASVQFTLTVTDMTGGCTGSSQVLVSVTGGPLSVYVTADPNPICQGDITQLLALVSGGTGNNVFSWSSNPPGFTSIIQNPTASPVISTTYIVSVYDGFATVQDSTHVSVFPLPGIPLQPSGPDTVDLQFVAATNYYVPVVPSADSYIWNLTPLDAGTISGSGTVGTVTWDQAFIGLAHVKVKTVNTCGESGWSVEKLTLVERSTGVSGDLKDVHLVIYPNPSHGVFKLAIQAKNHETYELSVIDPYGKKVFESNNLFIDGSFEKEISLNCSQGVYFILIKNEQGVTARRILIY